MLLSVFRLIPLSAWAIAAVLAWGAVQKHRATDAGTRALTAEKALAEIRADAAQLALQTAARTAAAHQEIAHVAQEQVARLRADSAGAGAALRRLRERAASAAGAAACAGAAPGSAPAGADAALPADLLDRVGKAAVELAAEADRYRIAGKACERAYDALTQSANPSFGPKP